LINLNQSIYGGEAMRRTIHRIAITKARINLGQVARRAHVNGDYFILEKDGIPVAGVLSADELEDYLEIRDPGMKAQIRKSNEEYRQGKGRTGSEFVAELGREARGAAASQAESPFAKYRGIGHGGRSKGKKAILRRIREMRGE
jgi:hypothetical protein